MNYNDKEFREKVLDIALQLVLVTGIIGSPHIIKKKFRDGSALKFDIDQVKSAPLRKWAEYAFMVRRHRETIFGSTLFSDPAWDILLKVLMSDLDGEPLTVSNASVVAEIPMTTGLRCINRLEVSGLVQRVADPSDRRIIWVRTTAKALQLLASQFDDEVEALRRLQYFEVRAQSEKIEVEAC